MSWMERGGPPVSAPQRRGFGSTVIASMAKAAVGGEVQLDYAPSGFVWRLTCPKANGLEPMRQTRSLKLVVSAGRFERQRIDGDAYSGLCDKVREVYWQLAKPLT
jgi:hypothetical protein